MAILFMKRTMPGRKNTNKRSRIFLFIVIQFFMNNAAMFVSDGSTKVFGFLFGVLALISLAFRVSASF